MNKLIVPVALAMVSVSMASTAFADGANGKGQGFENSLNGNACLNAGRGNGGEFVDGKTACGERGNEAPQCIGRLCPGDHDPGNSGTHNSVPPTMPPGQL